MVSRRWTQRLLPLLLVSSPIVAQQPAAGDFAACEPLPALAGQPGASDDTAEQAFCDIDYQGGSVALCPKTWSTSPAALVYDLEGTRWQGRAEAFEREVCPRGGSARDEAARELGFFKNSLNGRETSGTFAPASLLYYHFSRLLQTRVQVPVAVRQSFSVAEYRQRVVAPGVEYSSGGRAKMLHAGWLEMDRALAAPAQYSHRRELFDDTGTRLLGALLLADGKRYGAEVNGTRASGWGEGQNRDFQRSAPFLALRTDAPLAEAVAQGIAEARADPAMARALPADISAAQVAWWMHDITEVVLLDYILGQQDRVGNVDYLWRWVWQEEGVLRTARSEPAGPAQKLRITVLNDNDAGARASYANYARSTGMLDGWHHIDAGLYRRLQDLGADFRQGGPVAQAVRQNYRLSEREAQRIIDRGMAAADALRKRCRDGALRFDLGLADVLNPGAARAQPVDCGAAPDSRPVAREDSP